MKLPGSFVAVSLAVVTSLLAQTSNPQKRAITAKGLFDFVWVANPQVSPDGSRVCFTRVSVDEKHTGYETSLSRQ